jgi:hypothetical protein
MIRRRARLRPEYAALYPDSLWAGEWHDARWMTEMVRREAGRSAGGVGRSRPLDEAHFEFEGGDLRATSRADRRYQP